MNDFSLLWSLLVPGGVLLLAIGGTAKIYWDATRESKRGL
jgi:hypothetical protein